MLKELYKKIVTSFKPIYTQTVSINENEQCYEINVMKMVNILTL